LTAAIRALTDRLGELRELVAGEVAANGLESNQVAVDALVWAYAAEQAAAALTEWAAATRHPQAARLAVAAATEALARIEGAGWTDSVARAAELAEIGESAEALEDVGATEEHRLLRRSLRDLAEREIRPLATDIHRQDLDVPESVIQAVADFGLFGLSIPAEFGGAQHEADTRAMLIATEELSRASLAAGGSLITRPEILVCALLRGGTDEQRRRWLPAIASGAQLVAVAVTEPDFGSNVADLICRATPRAAGGWEISGTKLWCTFAGRSELLMLLARTGAAGHRGLSAFVLEKPAYRGHAFEHVQPGGGRLVGRAIPTIGYRGMHTFELAFDRYVAPPESLIGGDEWLNRGFYLQLEGFGQGRLQTAARAVGLMQAARESAVAYTEQRIVFGRAVAANQLARSRLGEMAVAVEGARRLSYLAADLVDAGAGQMEASLAKLYASRRAEAVTRDAAQLHGAMGYSEETDVARFFVDARVLPVFEGAEEILSLRVVGKALLGNG
jgi:(2S)-methylsuccinyl-CoA dehydrogenase